MKRSGSRLGPQMPMLGGFHSIGPSSSQVRQAPGEERQRLLQLGPGQRRAQAEVDAGAEGHVAGATGLAADVEAVRIVPDRRRRSWRRRGWSPRACRWGRGRRGTRCPPTRSGPCRGPRRGTRIVSSTAPAASSGSSASSAHWSGCSANSATEQASWLRVVSVPAMSTASVIITSSSVRQAVALLLGRDHVAEQVVGRPAAPLLDHRAHVGVELVHRRLDQRPDRWRGRC